MSYYLHHFEDLSIELNAENITCPALIIHGNNDEAVDVEQAISLKDLIDSMEKSLTEVHDAVLYFEHVDKLLQASNKKQFSILDKDNKKVYTFMHKQVNTNNN